MTQIRTYILIVGRGPDGTPVRRLFNYRVPIAGVTDHYEAMSPTALRVVEKHIEAERNRLDRALGDIRVEKETRLERL